MMQQTTAVNKIVMVLFTAVVVLGLGLITMPLQAASAALHIPSVKVISQQRVIYRCAGDMRIPVRYLNTDAGALAYIPAGGSKLLFVGVMAASGAKYAGGRYIWWTKGKEAFLEDVMQEQGNGPVLKDCLQVEKW